jgi:protein-disulfide isomerase
MTSRRRRTAALLAAAALSLVVAAVSGASPGTALVDGIPQRGTVLGEKTATVTLIVFEDLGCPHCRTYTETAFPAILEEYVRPGLVKIDFRGLGVITRASEPALRYAIAASRQRKLWQVVQLYYENQSRLNELATDKGVRRLVQGVKGLNVTKLIADARSLSVKKQIAAHRSEANRRNVPGTPWFFVKIGSAAPTPVRPQAYDGESFGAILDEALGR